MEEVSGISVEEDHLVENLKVAVRMRPLNKRESNPRFHKAGAKARAWHVLDEYSSVTQISNTGNPLPERVEGKTFFTFDKAFGETSGTKEVYEYAVRDLVTGVISGRNGSCFAYGQTSSGKTHTMQGRGSINDGAKNSEGFLHMSAIDIFQEITKQSDREFTVRVSVIEIYNEEVHDLLDNGLPLTIRQDPKKGVFVNAKREKVSNLRKLFATMSKGETNRAVASTSLNKRSSRSHTIFSIFIESTANTKTIRRGKSSDIIRSATLNLVDLAGSESVRHRDFHRKASTKRRNEGGSINKSLLTLSRVITALGSSGTHINYRDSKLTRVLQPTLSGNARLSFVCCISPSGLFLEETKSTLQFASRIKRVKTNTRINILDDDSAMERLQDELSEAKREIKEMKSKLDVILEENVELKALMKMMQKDRDMALQKVKSYERRNTKLYASPKSPASRDLISLEKNDEIAFDIEYKPSDIDQADKAVLDSLPIVKGMPTEIGFDNMSVIISEATPPSRYGSHKSLLVD